jgi:hypothetical protein
MTIHEYLPPQVRKELRQLGWSKGIELAKLARRQNGQGFNSAIWLQKAKQLSKEDLQREVERELTGEYSEAYDIVYFKLYKSQIPIVDKAIEIGGIEAICRSRHPQ